MKIIRTCAAMLLATVLLALPGCRPERSETTEAVRGVLERTLGRDCGDIDLQLTEPAADGLDSYRITASEGRLRDRKSVV